MDPTPVHERPVLKYPKTLRNRDHVNETLDSENPDRANTVLPYGTVREGSLAALATIAATYPARQAELHRLSVSYRRDPSTARPYIMALEALVAVALRSAVHTVPEAS